MNTPAELAHDARSVGRRRPSPAWDRWPTSCPGARLGVWSACATRCAGSTCTTPTMPATNGGAGPLDAEPSARALVAAHRRRHLQRPVRARRWAWRAPGSAATCRRDTTVPEDAATGLLTPNPRLVSTALLARGPEIIPATTLNVLAARVAAVPDPRLVQPRHRPDIGRSRCPARAGDDWPDRPDPAAADQRATRHARRPSAPRTFVNTETHWWDASQIYGSTPEFQQAVRRPAGPASSRSAPTA